METAITYSVVVPVYNSSESLVELFSEIKKVFTQINETFEVIFVDDSSKDDSWKILQRTKSENKEEKITLIQLTENFGQNKATLCGIDFSIGKYIITIDDDLQTPPSEILKLINHHKENPDIELIYGFYPNKKHSPVRNIGSKMMNINKLFRHSNKSGSSFRIIKSKLRDKLELAQYKNFVFIDELLLWSTGKVDFVEVEHHKRKYNKTGYTIPKFFSISKNLMIFSTSVPIKLMIFFGTFLSIISFLAGVFFIYRKLIHNVPMGYTSVIVSILFSTSIILLALGIIANYINAVFIQLNKKPTYLTKKVIK